MRVSMLQFKLKLKILVAVTGTQCSQTHKYILPKKKKTRVDSTELISHFQTGNDGLMLEGGLEQ